MNRCHSMDTVKPPPRLTAVTLGGIDAQSKAQLEAWQQRMERHEEIALGLEMVVSRDKLEGWLDEIGKRVEGLEGASACSKQGMRVSVDEEVV